MRDSRTQKVLSLVTFVALACGVAERSVVAQPSTQAARRFDNWDANKDGKLARDELPERIRGNFERVDTNDDGFISRAEDAAFTSRRAATEPGNTTRQPATRPPRLPDSIKLISDIPYAGTDNPRQMLDLMLPMERDKKPLPVVVFIHGGGWRNGSKDGGARRIADFVARGQYAGASIGYRLSGEAKWPNQIHDCKAAIRWLRANAANHGLDADRIGVWGTSAGGHLVAMLGTSGDVPAMDGVLGPHAGVSSRVTCVVDFFGPTNFLSMNKTAIEGATLDHDAPNSPESLLVGGPIQENPDQVATADPVTYVTPDDPPFLIVHGTRDPLVSFSQSELLHDALSKKDVTSTMITVAGGGHGSGFGPDVNTLVVQFFAHHLQGEETAWDDQTVQAQSRR